MHSRHVFIGGRWNGFSSSNTLPRFLFFSTRETSPRDPPLPSLRRDELQSRPDPVLAWKSTWKSSRPILQVWMTTLRDRRSTSTRLAARDITRDIDRDRKKRRMEKVRSFEVKNDIALVREQWKSGKCNWNERNDEFRIEFYDLSAIGNLCGKIGARKLEEQGKKFSGGRCATGVDTFHQGGERSGVRVSGGIRPLGVGSRARFIKIRPRVKEQAFRVPFLLPRLRSIKFYFGKIVS